jgi:hypothetical protein
MRISDQGTDSRHSSTSHFFSFSTSPGSQSHTNRNWAMANANSHAQISVAELAYGREPVYRRHPSNSESGHEDDEGEAYQALVKRCIEENERALTALELEGGGKVGVTGKADGHVRAGAHFQQV